MYSAYWCPHCYEQKEDFGEEAAKKLTVIECAADGQSSHRLFVKQKHRGYPWEINGKFRRETS